MGKPPIAAGQGIGSLEIEIDTKKKWIRLPDGRRRQILPDPDINAWLNLAGTNSVVGYVLDMVSSDAVRWASLYRTVESVKMAAGKHWKAAVGEVLDSQYDLFAHTANAPEAGGIDKRHPVGRQPLRKPMTRIQAEYYMRQVVGAFLRWKTSGH